MSETVTANEAKRRFMELDARIPHIHGVGKQFQSYIVKNELRRLTGFAIVEHSADATEHDGVETLHHIYAVDTHDGPRIPSASLDFAIADIDARISARPNPEQAPC
jgi:hypothetical protein